MSDFLDSLIDRSLGAGRAPGGASATLRPLLPSRFEPPRATPLFGSAAWDPSPDVSHNDTADQTSSPFGSANTDATPRGTSAVTGDWNRDDTRTPSSFPPMATAAPADDATRSLHLNAERPRAQDAFTSALQSSRRWEPDDTSWMRHRLDEMAVQLQRLRGDMAAPSPVRSAAIPSVPTPHENRVARTQPDFARVAESIAIDRRSRPAFDETTRGEDDSHADAMRATSTPSGEHLGQRRSAAPEFGQLDQLLSLAGRAAMQPPPRIQSEDLPSSRQSAPVEKTINVTIGRVEVKATREPAPVRRAAPSQAASSVMSLEDYLKQRAAGGLR